MNILNKAALQSLKKSRARTFVTIVGVILSSALITAVLTFGVSLLHYMETGAVHKYGSWHVAFWDADAAFAQRQAHNSQVSSVTAFENMGCAALPSVKDPAKPYLLIDGFYPDTFDALPFNLLSGRLPKNSGELLVSGSLSTKGGVPVKLGDRLTLSVGNRVSHGQRLGQGDSYRPAEEGLASTVQHTYTVVGICQTPDFEQDSAPGYTAVTALDAPDDSNDLSVFVTLKNPRQVHAYASRTAENHPYSFHSNVLRFLGLSNDPADRIFNTLLGSIGVIVTVIIMIGSIFLIYNSFSISLNERTHQFGILSSVGATAKQLRHSVLFEGFCIGIAGIPFGVLAGIGGITLVISVVASHFSSILYDNVPLTLTVSLPAIGAAAVVSMITILISAWLPARKAAKMPVMECIRQTNEIKVESSAVKTSALTQRICGLSGTLALKNFKRNKKRYRSIVLSLVLSVVLFLSASAFVMDLTQALEQTGSVTSYDIGVAVPDMDDSDMLSLYGRLNTAEGVYESSYQALMRASCTVRVSDLSEAYRKAAGIAWSKSQQSDRQSETVEMPTEIQFLDDSAYRDILRELGLHEQDYLGQNAKLIAVAKLQDSGNQAKTADQLKDLFSKTSISASIAPRTSADRAAVPDTGQSPKAASDENAHRAAVSNTGTSPTNGTQTDQAQHVSITLVNLTPPDTLPIMESAQKTTCFFRVIAPYSLKEKVEFPGIPTEMKGMTFRSKTPSLSADQMKSVLQSAEIPHGYTLYNMDQLMEQNRNYVFIANVFSYGFICMISLIAAANVFNTISTNIRLRRRELAMLRSLGMSDRDFNRMMRFECGFYGMRALLLGLPIAMVSSWLIYRGMVMGGAEEIHFAIPWGKVAISVLSVLLVILVTMTYAVRKIKKENIIDALRDDMA